MGLLGLVAGCGDGQKESAVSEAEWDVAAHQGDAPAPPPRSCLPRRDRYTDSAPPFRDGYVALDQPTTDFGATPFLDVDASPRTEAHLQFTVFPEGGRVLGARLRLWATAGTADGPRVHASGEWPPQGLTWDTRPALLGAPLADLGAVTAGRFTEVNVGRVVRGEGVYGFGLVATSSDGVRFASVEAPSLAQRPQLSVRFETAPFCSYRGDGSRGRTQGVRRFGGVGRDAVRALAADARGHVALVHRGAEADAGFLLARYGTNGLPVWTRSVAADGVTPTALTLTGLGSVLLVGRYTGAPDLGNGALPTSGAGVPALFIAKYSPTGRPLWSRGFVARDERPEPGHWPVRAAAVTTDAAGSLILTGSLQGRVDLGGGVLDAGLSSVQLEDPAAGALVAKFDSDGRHLWSRVVLGHLAESAVLGDVDTDEAGRTFVGGWSTLSSDFGDGQTGVRGPVVAAYGPSGALAWRRVLGGASGQVTGVRTSGASRVAFSAELGLEFLFGGQRFFVGQDRDDQRPFLGVLGNGGGEDGWLRPLEASVSSLAADASGIGASGAGFRAFDLGGGGIGNPQLQVGGRPFAARFDSLDGAHVWSRTFPSSLHHPGSRQALSQRPDGRFVLGLDLTGSASFDGRTLTSSGQEDLVYLQLRP